MDDKIKKQIADETHCMTTAATALEVCDQSSLDIAGERLVGVKKMLKQIDELWDDTIKNAHAAHKSAVAAKKTMTEPLKYIETTLKAKCGTYIKAERDRIGAMPIDTATSVAPPKTKGVSIKETWAYRIIDADRIEMAFYCLDEKKIAKTVKAMGKDAEAVVGGIEVFPKVGTAVTT